MISIEFLLTSLVVVLIPGTGVIYTVSNGLFAGRRASIAAAVGCTFGIVPHLMTSVLGLSAILHTSAVLFSVVKYAGAAYLLYLAWCMWNEKGSLDFKSEGTSGYLHIVVRGTLINVLNPKLSIFFLAFLPQFLMPGSVSIVPQMLMLSGIFMLMTFAVFVVYGLFAGSVRTYVTRRPSIVERMQQMFAVVFAMLGIKLALTSR